MPKIKIFCLSLFLVLINFMETKSSLNSIKILMNEPIINTIIANETINRATFIQKANDLIKNLSESENFHNNQSIWNRITKLSKLTYLFDEASQQIDQVYSSMISLGSSNSTSKNSPDLNIFNTYKPINEGGYTVNYKLNLSDYYVVEGDMILPKNSFEDSVKIFRRKKRKIVKETYASGFSSRWPQKIVPYEFDYEIGNDLAFKSLIMEAIKHWETRTCIKFEQYQKEKHRITHRGKVVFTKSDGGCFSNVGYPDQIFNPISETIASPIILGSGCVLGQIIHEIGHSIGFFHEQSRVDRDNYITINWENIVDPIKNNINFQAAETQIEPDFLGIPYDINSIMHYQSTAFGIKSQKTIEALDPNLEFLMGNRVGLSFYDIKTANLAYKCSENCLNIPMCQNDGFVNSDCNCECPSSTTGKYCENYIATTEESKFLSELNLSCDFSKNLCDWKQEVFKDEIDFTMAKGKTLLASFKGNSGPISDRNGDKNGVYLYINSYYIKYPSESALLISPLISVFQQTVFCLKFWYHMYSDSTAMIGSLEVQLIEMDKPDTVKTIWSRAGSQPHNQSEWLLAQLTLNVDSSFRVIFKAQRYLNFYGDIGLDDIFLENQECLLPDLKPTQWTEWYIWSKCSVSCGIGFRERKRICQIGSGKSICDGDSMEKSICFNEICKENTSNIQYTKLTTKNRYSIDGKWSKWSSWSSCDLCKINNGNIKRTRLCNNPAPSNGGKNCVGIDVDFKSCYETTDCKINGGWSQWSKWSECSAKCWGYQFRSRKCNNPEPENGGSYCDGFSDQNQICNSFPCEFESNQKPTTTTISTTIYSEFRNKEEEKSFNTKEPTIDYLNDTCTKYCSSWSEWSHCEKKCGNNFQKQSRERSCSSKSHLYGCKSFETKSCVFKCYFENDFVLDEGLCLTPVNGQWSNWKDWSSCSGKCGGSGTMKRYRTCDNPEPFNGGLNCIGSNYEISICETDPCENSEECFKPWSIWTECSASCGFGFKRRVRMPLQYCPHSNPIYSYDGCWAGTCVESHLSEWSPWTVCSDCTSNGYKYRFRKCIGSSCGSFSLFEKVLCSQTIKNLIENSSVLTFLSKLFTFNPQISTTNSINTYNYTKNSESALKIWSSWSDCSTNDCKTNGYRSRIRFCDKQSDDCKTDSIYYEACIGSKNCIGETKNQIDKENWSEWSEWSECSSDCGNGTRKRERFCNNNQICIGSNSEFKDCLVESGCSFEFYCTFDFLEEKNCKYVFPKYESFKLSSFSKREPHSPIGDWPTGYGFYLNSNPFDIQDGKSSLETVSLKSGSSGQCLKFWYSLNGISPGIFNVKLLINDTEFILFTKSENIGITWIEGSSIIPANVVYKLKFEFIFDKHVSSNLALDLISINPSSECSVLKCDFEDYNNQCLFNEYSTSLQSKRTYQTNNKLWHNLGQYFNLITSIQNVSHFSLPVHNFNFGQTICLSFSYFTSTPFSKLNVYIKKDDYVNQLLWTSTQPTKFLAHLESNWRTDFIDINSSENHLNFKSFKIIFEMIRGPYQVEEIAIDEIELDKTLCISKKINHSQKNSVKNKENVRFKRQITSRTFQGCGGAFHLTGDESLYITSPNYPNNYPLNTECSYILTSEKNNRLLIEIIDLHMETTTFNLCPDSLEIRYFALGQIGVRLCGTFNQTVLNKQIFNEKTKFTSHRNSALLHFRSDWMTSFKGFKTLISVLPMEN